MLSLVLFAERMTFLRSSLHVAMQTGPYLHPIARMSGVWPLRILASSPVFPAGLPHPSHCHCPRGGRVVWDTRVFQHIAGCTPCRCRHGGQRSYLRQICYYLRISASGPVISAGLCMSPCSSDCIFALSGRASGVQSLRIPPSTCSSLYFLCLPLAFI